MLVLARKKGQWIYLNRGFVKIVVVEIRRDDVRIGIEAPPEIEVHREEIVKLIEGKENQNKEQKQ